MILPVGSTGKIWVMHVRDWVRTLSPPVVPRGSTVWHTCCPESRAPLLATWWSSQPDDARTALIVTPDHERALQWQARLTLCGVPPAVIRLLPSGQAALFDDGPPERYAVSDRAGSLLSLAADAESIVIATPGALLERTTSRSSFLESVITIRVGDEFPTSEFVRRIVELGYEREEPVRRPGGYSVRGGILDLFPAGAELPTRIEFFGDEIESIRRFDPESQRSVGTTDAVRLAPIRSVMYRGRGERAADAACVLLKEQVGALSESTQFALVESIESDIALLRRGAYFDRLELYAPLIESEPHCALDFVASGVVFIDDPYECEARAERAVEDIRHLIDHRHADGSVLDMNATEYVLGPARLKLHPHSVRMVVGVEDEGEKVDTASLAPYRGKSEALAAAIASWKREGVRIFVTSDQPTRSDAVLKNVDVFPREFPEGDAPPDWDGATAVRLKGNLGGGFIRSSQKYAVLTDSELFGVSRLRLPQKRFSEGAPIASVLDLKPGDFVVHIQYGIGIYRGLVTRDVDGVSKEMLHVQYQSPDQLFVPTDQLDRIQKYLSPSDGTPTLHRITGGDWQRTLRNARRGAEDLARDLIKLYANRVSATRPAYGEDSPWQAELEATFPWVETKSQLQAVEEIKGDLDESHPMDRLVCGDVGFGKTEVAVRAAFKVAQFGKQVAVLCPTTVLSDQHFDTFRERLSPFPIQLRVLNRFRNAAERKETLAGLKSGEVQIVVGTHALIQKDVEFKDLGLVIVDEEQRFGVKHKERLKELRTTCDFLTLTATPIPRTLSMALMNIRELSVIGDPPPGRLPIRTYVRPFGEPIVREALLRELARGGQAFYVYNRIDGIQHIAEKVRKLVPNARVAIAHGQMTANELEPIMLAFFHGEVDILVCTTIVENGIDNPNANTMVVEAADRLGLAQLYQLRGRVGRSDRQAYAYLLYRSGKNLTEGAMERLKALQEFSELGSGYALAFRDLQIRGAGELLGSKQHGVMATVGYEMYVHLINQAVQQLKTALDSGGESGARLTKVEFEQAEAVQFDELPVFDIPAEAYLPTSYVPDQSQRLFLYKRLMEARDEEHVKETEDELLDRFGPLPREAENALTLLRLRIEARRIGIRKVEGRMGRLIAWLVKGRELPLRVVHALQREHKGLRFRNDMVEWRMGEQVIADTAELITLIAFHRDAVAPTR